MRKIKIKEVNYFIPQAWDEVTVGDFEAIYPILQEITKEQGEDVKELALKHLIRIVVRITGIEKQVLMQAPKQFFDLLTAELGFLWDNSSRSYKADKDIEIDGVLHYFPQEEAEISLGQFVDMEETTKGPEPLSSMLAILLLPKGEDYDSKYFKQRQIKMQALPMHKALPLINFFLLSEKAYTILLKTFLQGKAAGLDTLQHLKNSLINGDGIAPLAPWQKTILLKWIASLQNQLLRS